MPAKTMAPLWVLAKRTATPQILGIMSSPQFCLLPYRGVIAVAGEDRIEFLQGLISNDVTKVAPGKAIWAPLLTPQGRFLNAIFAVDPGFRTLLLDAAHT